MSVIEYKYQKATHEQLEKCMRWCQNQLQLRDWEVNFSTDSMPPIRFLGDCDITSCFGRGWINTNGLKAEIWVNADYHKAEDQNLYATTIHEAIHIMQLDREDDAPELITRILEPMLYRLYCYENGLKVMGEK